MRIYCCGCKGEVEARLTNGEEIYPPRKNLHTLPFWKCDACGNYVGCHHKTADRTKPLGVIPTEEIRKARSQIHNLIDPLWKSRKIKRGTLYKILSEKLGREYHTGDVRSMEEVSLIFLQVSKLKRERSIEVAPKVRSKTQQRQLNRRKSHRKEYKRDH